MPGAKVISTSETLAEVNTNSLLHLGAGLWMRHKKPN